MATEQLAKVRIFGNTSATRGGGIGSNGTVIMGTPEETQVDITKVWQESADPGAISAKKPDSIVVELWATYAMVR